MQIQSRSQRIVQLSIVCIVAVATLVQIDAQDLLRPPGPESTPQEQSDKSRKGDRRQGGQPDDPGQESNAESIKIETELVQLDVIVVDRKNNPVLNLNRDNFTVYENKVQQMINSVSREEVPLSFGIAVDTSGSMRTRLRTVSEAVRGLIQQMQADDEAFLSQFKTETELVHEFSSDKGELEKSLELFFTSGGTALLDAIIAASDYAQEKGRRRRKAIIVISDGLDKNSAAKEKEVISAIRENEVQLYMIGFLDEDESKSFFGSSDRRRAQQLLTRLADDSGGRAFFPKDLNEIPAIAAQIAKDMRTQYIVSYYPSNSQRDGSFRSVRVEVNSYNNRKLTARTRLGYYARSGQGLMRGLGRVRYRGKV
jgi:Ca-activated chloride channel homolog